MPSQLSVPSSSARSRGTASTNRNSHRAAVFRTNSSGPASGSSSLLASQEGPCALPARAATPLVSKTSSALPAKGSRRRASFSSSKRLQGSIRAVSVSGNSSELMNPSRADSTTESDSVKHRSDARLFKRKDVASLEPLSQNYELDVGAGLVLWDCPLCMEEVDAQDAEFVPCECGYQICRFCWHHIKSVLNDKCPACRRSYSEQEPNLATLQLKRIVVNKPVKRRDPKSSLATDNVPESSQTVSSSTTTRGGVPLGNVLASRKHLVDIRVLQPNLVYVIGIPINLSCYSSPFLGASASTVASSALLEDILSSIDYFGRYGHLLKLVVNMKGQSVLRNPSRLKGSPTVSAFLTFEKKEQASLAIENIDGSYILDFPLRATYGTTKYCAFFLRGQTCPNLSTCLYLHEFGEDANSYTKESLSARQRDTQLKRTLENGTEIITHSLNTPPINRRRSFSGQDSIQITDKVATRTPNLRGQKTIEKQPSACSDFNVENSSLPSQSIALPHVFSPSLFPLDQPTSTLFTCVNSQSSKLIGPACNSSNSPAPTVIQFDPLDSSNDIKVNASNTGPSSPSLFPFSPSCGPSVMMPTKTSLPFSRPRSRFGFDCEETANTDTSAAHCASYMDLGLPAVSEPSVVLKRFQDLSISTILDQHMESAPTSFTISPSSMVPCSSDSQPPLLSDTSCHPMSGKNVSSSPPVDEVGLRSSSNVGNAKVSNISSNEVKSKGSTPSKNRVIPGYEPVSKKKSEKHADASLKSTPSETSAVSAVDGASNLSCIDSEEITRQIQQLEYYAQLKQSSKKSNSRRSGNQVSASTNASGRNVAVAASSNRNAKKSAVKEAPSNVVVDVPPKKPALIASVKDDNIFSALLDDDPNVEDQDVIADPELFLKPVSKKKKKKVPAPIGTNQTVTASEHPVNDLGTSRTSEINETDALSSNCAASVGVNKGKKKKKKSKKKTPSDGPAMSNQCSTGSSNCHAISCRPKTAKELAFEAALHRDTDDGTDSSISFDVDDFGGLKGLSESFLLGQRFHGMKPHKQGFLSCASEKGLSLHFRGAPQVEPLESCRSTAGVDVNSPSMPSIGTNSTFGCSKGKCFNRLMDILAEGLMLTRRELLELHGRRCANLSDKSPICAPESLNGYAAAVYERSLNSVFRIMDALIKDEMASTKEHESLSNDKSNSFKPAVADLQEEASEYIDLPPELEDPDYLRQALEFMLLYKTAGATLMQQETEEACDDMCWADELAFRVYEDFWLSCTGPAHLSSSMYTSSCDSGGLDDESHEEDDSDFDFPANFHDRLLQEFRRRVMAGELRPEDLHAEDLGLTDGDVLVDIETCNTPSSDHHHHQQPNVVVLEENNNNNKEYSTEKHIESLELELLQSQKESKFIEEKLMKVMLRNRTFVYVD